MLKSLAVFAALAVAAVLVYVLRPPPTPPGSGSNLPPTASVEAPATAAKGATAPQQSVAPAAAAASAPAPALATDTGAAPHKAWPTPELTRALRNPEAVRIGDRDWSVLGVREIVGASGGNQTTLVLRDETSGQLNYRQSALRFVLTEGQDYEAFIRSRGAVTRLFANPLYADIGVDPARIAAEYAALASDRRVAKVMFIPLEVRATPK